MTWRWLVLVFAAVLLLAVTVLSFVLWPREQHLRVTTDTLAKLQALQKADTFADLPGVEPSAERRQMKSALDELLLRLIAGFELNPRKSWVLSQMKPTVARIYLEDTEARERFVDYLQQILDILEIKSTNGAFIRYLIFI